MGFDTERFVPSILPTNMFTKQVICQICKLVFEDPLQVLSNV